MYEDYAYPDFVLAKGTRQYTEINVFYTSLIEV